MSDDIEETVSKIPLLHSTASPKDKDHWQERLKEELVSLIAVVAMVGITFQYVKLNKKNDSDWFKLSCDKSGIQQFYWVKVMSQLEWNLLDLLQTGEV